MLIEFSVQNFGSIKDKQTLSFEAAKDKHLEDYYVIPTKIKGLRLLKLGLIYGANASGKTTFLQALDFLRNIVLSPKKEKNMTFEFEPFLFDEKTPSQNTIFNISFIQNNIRYDYEVELNKRAIIKEKLDFYSPNKANIFTRTSDIKKQYTYSIIFGSKIKKNKNAEDILKANTLWNNTVIGGFAKTNIENKELKDVKDWFSLYLESIMPSETKSFENMVKKLEDENNLKNKNSIIEIIRSADFNINNFSTEKMQSEFFASEFFTEIIKVAKEIIETIPLEKDDKKRLYKNFDFNTTTFEHSVNEKNFKLPIEAESLGTQRYYILARVLLLLIKKPMMILIDELESSLHPDLFRHFILSFIVNSKNSQIIATTHNREILNDKDIFRNDTIWITDKNKESATQLYSLSNFDSSVIRDTTNIYNAYKVGKLGGIPNLGSYHIEVEE